jgi:hypothetical protein
MGNPLAQTGAHELLELPAPDFGFTFDADHLNTVLGNISVADHEARLYRHV